MSIKLVRNRSLCHALVGLTKMTVRELFNYKPLLGVILCPIMTTKDNDKPFVLILDAKDMSELARCYVEHRLPLGFHAHFVNNK